MSSITLPKRSNATACATSAPFSERASGICSSTSVSASIGSPAPARGPSVSGGGPRAGGEERGGGGEGGGGGREPMLRAAHLDRLDDAAEALGGGQEQAVV